MHFMPDAVTEHSVQHSAHRQGSKPKQTPLLAAMAPDAKTVSLGRLLHDLTQILQSSSMEESTGTATQGEVAPRVRQMLLRLMQCCATLDNGKQELSIHVELLRVIARGLLCQAQPGADQ